MRKVVLYQSLTHRSRMDQLSADSKRGPALLPAPVSPDFGSWVPKDTWAWFRRHAPLAPARACELRVGRRGRCVSAPEGVSVSRTSSARFNTAGGSIQALLGALFRTIPKLRAAFAALPFEASGPACAFPSARCFRAAFAALPHPTHRSHPRTGFRWSPEGFRCLPIRCKSLALLWFPSAPPPPYSYETVTESAAWKARNEPFCLLITWITGTSRAIRGRIASIPGEPVRTPQSRTRVPPRSSPAPSRPALR